MKTIVITIFGHEVECPDLPEYRKFYGKLGAGVWEPHTFAVLRQHLDKATVYVDIGGWIGVLPFWASRLAKRVVVVEPDPRCREILAALAPTHSNVTIVEGALSAGSPVRLNAVSGFGSSETSVLEIGDGPSLTVPGISMDDIMRHAGADLTFVKIDIEGYEYRVASEIAKLRYYRVRGIQCALHPELYERSLRGNRMWRRMRTAAVTWRLGTMFSAWFDRPHVPGFSSFTAYLIQGVILRRVPMGKDLLFLRRPNT